MRALFKLFALLMLAAAVYHGIGLLHRLNEAPLWRRALFIAIDLFCVFGFLRRPSYFLWFFAALTLQQWVSHGEAFASANMPAHGFPWLDGGVVLFMTTALACLVFDRYRNGRSTT